MKKTGIIFWLSIFFICILGNLSGCGEKVKIQGNTEDKITIVTSFYPMYVLTLNVTKNVEDIEVVNMTQPQTGCLHDYQLTIADMKVLDKADILVVNGAGMESFLDKVIDQLPQLRLIVASEGMDLLEDTHEMHLDPESEEKNPHIWVSPTGAAGEVERIAAGLAEEDPSHADQYQANAEEFIEQMGILKTQMQQQFDKLSNRKLITFHEAFPYFSREFGFEIAAVIENEPGQEPTAREIEAVIDTIQTNRIPAIFVETQYSDRIAQMIAAETGIDLYEVDLLVTGETERTPEEVRGAYIEAMQKNLKVFMEALQ